MGGGGAYLGRTLCVGILIGVEGRWQRGDGMDVFALR